MSNRSLLEEWRADEETENFALCLFRDIIGCFSIVARLDIRFPPELEEERCVPEGFFREMINFSRPFISHLMADISRLPVLLYASSDFFKRFAHTVCRALSRREDDQISFLKVIVFLVALTAISFVHGCYRSFDDIPDIFYRMLKEHLGTKFYKEGKFEEMVSKCNELKADEKWGSKLLDELRSAMEESCQVELAATKLSSHCYEKGIHALKIRDVENPDEDSDSEERKCRYCGIECIVLLRVFFQPKIMYKPECDQM